ncbi:MAG: hypothetical protein RML93_05505 [Anaerolineales bacterium]|nr:hypothetical protein [Anaerolineales bacterium]MCS7248363.1 hypothetical protein [Anaerolineales bacterium]MDW8162176.1 hypothetical protein [Anaerolineales bacterium]MDW8446731.1 hypothetical protein [Anaerolineales bacterium]
MRKPLRWLGLLLLVLLGFALVLEIGVRIYVEAPLETDFYGSIARQAVGALQAQVGVQTLSGSQWVHLGWIADPEKETYRIELRTPEGWREVGQTQFGSFLDRGSGGTYRVWRVPKDRSPHALLGEVTVQPTFEPSPIYLPRIGGEWRELFRPRQYGWYINDHTIYQDAQGNWRLVGITSLTNGDFNEEKYFAVGMSQDFPPVKGMIEQPPIADFGELAWAPHVIRSEGEYHMFWSPHKLHQMNSRNGIDWENHRITLTAPYHKFFRDAMVLQVAQNQWLLYTTARGPYFSQIDLYQSFDLTHWQYIRTALRSAWGSERNSPFASMESPFVVRYQNHYYLSLTYNNDSFFWHGILLMFKIWLNKPSYNDTLVFHADNPYDFGVYRGLTRSSTLLTRLEAHAPEWVYHPTTGRWYITTAGWPWAATLTSGEVAVAPIEWVEAP